MGIVADMMKVEIFKREIEGSSWKWTTGKFIGRPFYLDYSRAQVLVSDYWKEQAQGLPQGCFLLAYYDCNPEDEHLEEALLLRVREPAPLPMERDIVSSMVEYYKENLRTGNAHISELDQMTRYDFSFSGLSCSILGCFYKVGSEIQFGADVENFYAPHNYSVIKPSENILKFIVNYNKDGVSQEKSNFRIGYVRYSSSRRFQVSTREIPIYVNATDFAGKRTGLFGMTRTGKSNTIKKIIQANVSISEGTPYRLGGRKEAESELLQQFIDGKAKYPIGQIIFDMNGEYANANLQDNGTAIFDLYRDKTKRYSIIEKSGFKVLKTNFYNEIEAGFELLRNQEDISSDKTRFATNFFAVDLTPPQNDDPSAITRHERRIAVYKCILFRAGFELPEKHAQVRFRAAEEIRKLIDPRVNPGTGINMEQACYWWENLWKIYTKAPFFDDYKEKNQKEWADDDLKALLVMLTRKSSGSGRADCSGFRILTPARELHTASEQMPFEEEILMNLREGNIVIIDLSVGNEQIQKLYSDKITQYVFKDSIQRFISARPCNFIQFYFEEAHNLFLKKNDADLSQIYNRLAKEGAKFSLGLVYATQEVSSISSNILKNTQNWFISHLNNTDEIKELKKYYDFSDFSDSLIRFSQDTDKGFARVKIYSKPFVIPMQIDRFAKKGA